MTPYKPKQGTYEIDRIFPTLGRVRIRTGVRDRRLAQRYEVMLETLPLATVQLIADRRLPIRVAYDAWASGQVAGLPTARTLLSLADELTWWLDKPALPVGPSEAASRQRAAEYLLGIGARLVPVVDLPALLAELRMFLEDRPAAFNRTRAACLAFVRDRFAGVVSLHDAVVAVPSLLERRLRGHHPCTVDEARAIAAQLGVKWGPAWWSMCITGMGPKEYWRDGWKLLTEGVEIFGAKDTTRRQTTARRRVVPILGEMAPAPGTSWGFTLALRRAHLGVTPYDARRSYARWLDDVGLAGYVQDALMGHGPKSMRELYKWGEIRSMLGEVRERMLSYIGAVPQITRSSGTEGS